MSDWQRDPGKAAQRGDPALRKEILDCLNTLYDDRIQPSLGVLRRRVKERTNELVHVDALRVVVNSLCVQGTVVVPEDADACILLATRTGDFVDPMDPEDPYPQKVYDDLENFCNWLTTQPDGGVFKGGRYGMATQIKHQPFLKAYCLGQIAHMVQLSIAKRVVGYMKGGALVAFSHSRAAQKADTDAEMAKLTGDLEVIQDWPTMRAATILMWFSRPEYQTQGVGLSFVRQEILELTGRTLVESALGHDKLISVFQAPEMAGVCEVDYADSFTPRLSPPRLELPSKVLVPKVTPERPPPPLNPRVATNGVPVDALRQPGRVKKADVEEGFKNKKDRGKGEWAAKAAGKGGAGATLAQMLGPLDAAGVHAFPPFQPPPFPFDASKMPLVPPGFDVASLGYPFPFGIPPGGLPGFPPIPVDPAAAASMDVPPPPPPPPKPPADTSSLQALVSAGLLSTEGPKGDTQSIPSAPPMPGRKDPQPWAAGPGNLPPPPPPPGKGNKAGESEEAIFADITAAFGDGDAFGDGEEDF